MTKSTQWIKDYDIHFLSPDRFDSSGQYNKEFMGRLYTEHIKFIKALLKTEREKAVKETVDKMISEAWKCRFEDVQLDYVVTHGDLRSCGYELLKKLNNEM